MRDELWNVWAKTMEDKFKNNSAITEVLEVDNEVGAPRKALDRIKSCLKRDTEPPTYVLIPFGDTELSNQHSGDTEHSEQPSWIKKKFNKIAKFFKR